MSQLFTRSAFAGLLLLGAATAAHGSGGDDHTHGDEPKQALQAAAPRVVATSDAFELVGVLDATGLVIYLDRPGTTEPVTDAAISADVDGKSVEAKPGDDGTYRLAGDWSARAGQHSFVFTVARGDEADLLAGSLDIPHGLDGQHAHAPPWVWAAGAGALLLALGAGVLAMRRRRGAVAAAGLAYAAIALVYGGLVATPALASGGDDHTHGDEAPAAAAGYVLGAPETPRRLPNGSLFVPKSTQRLLGLRTAMATTAPAARTVQLFGRLVPDPGRAGIVQSASGGRVIPAGRGLPRLGASVARGDVLLYVEPAASSGDLSSITQERLQVDADLEVARRRLARLESLEGTVAGREIDEARVRVTTLERRATEIASSASRREVLRAPIGGRVARMDAIAGQVVGPERVLVEIVAEDALVVEASAHGAARFAERAAARLPDGRSIPLELLEQGSALSNQSVTVRFALAAPQDVRQLPVNTPLTVLASLVEQQEGIPVPRASVVQSTAGTPMVWVKVAPETFAPRDVRYAELDGDTVLVVAGLKSPARVVVAAGALINQIR